MGLMWEVEIRNLQTGDVELVVDCSAGSWDSRVTGRGRGSHSIPLFNAGISQSLIWELKEGNKYTVVQKWDDHVAFAGVVGRADFDDDSRVLTLVSQELRGAYFNARLLDGVGFPFTPGQAVLSVASKSHAGAVRATIEKSIDMKDSSWGLPLDKPADGSGSFTADWLYEDRLKWEDIIAQIEADGCEVFFRPYLDGAGKLRWATEVLPRIVTGVATEYVHGAADSPLYGLRAQFDFAEQVTGIQGFGRDGELASAAYVGTTPISVRDTWLNFADFDGVRLQAAVDAAFAQHVGPTVQWSLGAHIYPGGPESFEVGRLLDLSFTGHEFFPDGVQEKRVVAVSGDLGDQVSLEVQDA